MNLSRYGASRRLAPIVVGVCVAAVSAFAASGSAFAAKAAKAGKPVNIGAIVTETGPVATGGGYLYAAGEAKAWAAWKNSQGGLNGHPVRLTVLDDANSPDTATGDARELVERDHVAAVFVEDQYASALAPYLAAQHVPLFSSFGDGGHTQKDTTWFGVDISSPYVPDDFAQADKAAGATKIANAVCSEVSVCLSFGPLLSTFDSKIGVQAGATVAIAETATDATAQCLAITQSGANAINLFVGTNPISLISQACKSQGYKGILTTGSIVDVLFKTVNVPMVLVAGSFPWWGTDAASVQYRDIMAKYAGGGDYESVDASNMWELLQTFAAGMTAKGPAASAPVTSKSVIFAMQHGVKNLTLGGLLPQPITFSPKGSTVVRCFWPGRFTANGQFAAVSGSWKSGNGVASGALKSDCVSASAA